MAERERAKAGKITLDIELQDILDIVSKSGRQPALGDSSSHIIEGEDLKKAWFKHLLISLEKINDLVETIRRNDLVNIRNEFKEEIKELRLKIDKNEDELEKYKKDVISPINTKVITLTVKLGLWSVVAGFIGSGIMGLVLFITKEYLLKLGSLGTP
jgi:hypothetical protein